MLYCDRVELIVAFLRPEQFLYTDFMQIDRQMDRQTERRMVRCDKNGSEIDAN